MKLSNIFRCSGITYEEDIYMQAKELKIYKGSGRNYTPIPQIIIQGKWLRTLGFFIGDKVTVTQDGNRLIVEKCEDGNNADEESAMIAKPVHVR